ncbi:DNA repair protein RecO [Nevskia ramosa]|uniref:DNA repair protein RecO n=1 Tax=Nevskia ramosa TaxID=64002 RepID=UPI002355AC69
MSSARIELQPAWLLSQKPYRETSELLEVLTPQHGRVGLVARGLRGPRAKQRGVVSLFRPLLLSWLDKGELGTVTAVEAGGPEVQLVGERLFHGWYLNELLLKLLIRHDPHPGLWDDYTLALAGLGGDAVEAEAALRVFEKRLLELLGYGLPLEDTIDPEAHFRFRAGSGFLQCESEADGALAGSSLLALHRESLSNPAELDDARRLMRAALEPHVPRASLRTPGLLRQLKALRTEA